MVHVICLSMVVDRTNYFVSGYTVSSSLFIFFIFFVCCCYCQILGGFILSFATMAWITKTLSIKHTDNWRYRIFFLLPIFVYCDYAVFFMLAAPWHGWYTTIPRCACVCVCVCTEQSTYKVEHIKYLTSIRLEARQHQECNNTSRRKSFIYRRYWMEKKKATSKLTRDFKSPERFSYIEIGIGRDGARCLILRAICIVH